MAISLESIRRLDELVRNSDQLLRDRFFEGVIAFTVIVGIGVFLEFAEHLPIRITRFNENGWLVVRHDLARWKRRAEWISTIVVLIGLAGEGLFEGLTSRADNILQTFNEVLIGSAVLRASDADERAEEARATAAGFDSSIAASNAEAKKATAQARSAEALAKKYESQIAESTARVKEAEARAAEARSMAEADHLARVKIEEQLERIRLPRTLINVSQLAATLRSFKDAEYTFSGVFADEESRNLVKQIEGMLQLAGWKRVKESAIKINVPAFRVFGPADDLVDMSASAGVNISVDSTKKIEVLQALPVEKLPPLVRLGVLLNDGIFLNLSPPEDSKDKNRVDVQPGTSTVIRIDVGKKP